MAFSLEGAGAGAEAEGVGEGRRQGSLPRHPRGARLGPLRQLFGARRTCSALPQARHQMRKAVALALAEERRHYGDAEVTITTDLPKTLRRGRYR